MKQIEAKSLGLLTVEQAAATLEPAVNPRTIRNWINEGRLPAVVIPGARYYLVRTVDLAKLKRPKKGPAPKKK